MLSREVGDLRLPVGSRTHPTFRGPRKTNLGPMSSILNGNGRGPLKVIIAGAGIGGLVTAIALHAIGADIHVYEAARELKTAGVGINLQPHAVLVLRNLGLLDDLEGQGI